MAITTNSIENENHEYTNKSGECHLTFWQFLTSSFVESEQPLCPPDRVRCLGGKPVKTGGDVDAAAKKRPEEALFAALRPHDYRLRTCSRALTANGRHAQINKIDYLIIKSF